MPNLLLKSAGILLVAALVAFAGLLFSMPELSAQETDSDGEPAATPTPVPPTATPTPRPDATVALSSQRVNWDDVITIRGENFDPSVPLQVEIVPWRDGYGRKDITPSPVPQTDDHGSFEFEITIASSHSGGHYINVFGGRDWVQPHISIIVPSLSLSAYSGTAGSVIAVSGSDFSPGPFTVMVGGVDVTPSPLPSIDRSGRMKFDLQIPWFSPGDYLVKVIKNEVHYHHSYFTVVNPPTPTPAPTATPMPTPMSPPTIYLSPSSGAPGSRITLRGEGFKPFAQVQRVDVSSSEFDIEITPQPAPSTNDQGIMEFDIIIPGLEPGRYYIGVAVPGRATRVWFTVTAASPPPPLIITLSANSGAPGSIITLRGEGFKPYIPVWSVSIGGIEVLPQPAPSTNAQGVTEFDILIPGLESGLYAFDIQASDANANIDFTVTAASVPPPTPRPTSTPYATPTPTAAPPQLQGGSGVPPHIFIGTANLNGSPAGPGIAIDAYDGGRLIGATVTQAGGQFSIHTHRAEGVITFQVNNQIAAESWPAWRQGQVTTGFNLTAAAGSSNETDPARLFAALPDLVRAFAFDNTTKSWFFFDPAAAEVSTLTRFIPQHAYWLLVSHTTRLLLNGVERNLSCVADDCWNIIVW